MEPQWEWQKLQNEQKQRIADALSDDPEKSWIGIRTLVEEAPPIEENGSPAIWEGPGRAATLPLSYEALTTFIRQHDGEAQQILAKHSNDRNPVVAGHCLMALGWCHSELLTEAVSRCEARTDMIHSIYGSFGWEGSLHEYGERLLDD